MLQENVNDATWLGDSNWIGFISVVNGKRQGFIVHPDGSELSRMTNSNNDVIGLKPVFNNGVFWDEGIFSARSTLTIANKWTKLDKTESKLTNLVAVLPGARYIITRSAINHSTFELTDITTGEIKEISLSKPDENSILKS